MGEYHPKKGHSSLSSGQHETIDFIESVPREEGSVTRLCKLFNIGRSSFEYHIRHKDKACPERERLKSLATTIHKTSRGAAGARTIAGELTQQGEDIGRYGASKVTTSQLADSALKERLNKYKAEMLCAMGEVEEYDSLCAEHPELRENAQGLYNEARERSGKLLGKLKAPECILTQYNR